MIQTESPSIRMRNLEVKLVDLEDEVVASVDTVELKDKTLREHVEKIKLIINDEKEKRERVKIKLMEQLRNLDSKVAFILKEEFEGIKASIESWRKNVILTVSEAKNNLAGESSIIGKNMQTLKSFLEVDMMSAIKKIDEESEHRQETFEKLSAEMKQQFAKIKEKLDQETNEKADAEAEFKDNIAQLDERVSEEFQEERNKREDFEEKVFKLLEETISRVVKAGETEQRH